MIVGVPKEIKEQEHRAQRSAQPEVAGGGVVSGSPISESA